VDPKAGTVTIAHQPISAIGWPAMTMPFKVADPALLDKLVAGSRIRFTLESASNPRILSLQVVK
jgi:Cu(I)/Ag(I) efflux system protein CusF